MRRSANLILLLCSTLFSLFLCELALGLLGHPREHLPQVAHEAGLEVERENIEFSYLFTTNSQGLRYREMPVGRDASFRVFVLGDSFTEGWGVAEGERFTDLLERHYSRPGRRVLFINGGITGTGPADYRRVFFEIGLKYRPDALLVCLFANDLANMPASSADGKLGFQAISSSSLVGRLARSLWPRVVTLLEQLLARRERAEKTRSTDFVATVAEQARRRGIAEARIEAWEAAVPRDLIEAVERGEFVGAYLSRGLLEPSYWTQSIDISSPKAEKKWRNLTLALSQILTRARHAGVEPAVVFIPSRFQYDLRSHSSNNPWVASGSQVRESWLTEDSEIQRRLRTWSDEHEVPFLDLTSTFRAAVRAGDKVNWELDGHWNRQGHVIAAETISRWLSERRVFSLPRNGSPEKDAGDER